MATVNSGTYIIRPVVNTSLALDIAGDVDHRGANVYLDTYSKDDGQFWHLVPDGSGARVVNALSGKYLDLEVTHGFESETNVHQYDLSSSSITQTWKVETDGKSVTIDGTSYPTYTIKCANKTTLALDATGAATTPGTNIWVYTVNGTNAQRFVLFDAGMLPDGYYEIRPSAALDLCMGIYPERRNEDGAPVITMADTAENHMIWRTITDTTGSMRVRNVHSIKYLRLDSETPRAGMPLTQWRGDGSTTKLFAIHQEGSAGGQPTYRLRAFNGTGYSADCAATTGRIKTQMTLEADRSSTTQLFRFDRIVPISPISAPSDYKLRYPDSYTYHQREWSRMWGNDPTGSVDNGNGSWTSNLNLSYVATVPHAQMRYRLITTDALTGTVTTGPWRNLGNDSTAFDGWGYPTTPSFVASRVDSRMVAPMVLPITIGTQSGQSRKVTVEVQGRAFFWVSNDEYGDGARRSVLSSGKMDVLWSDTPTFGNFRYTGLGLVATLAHDYPVYGVSTDLTAKCGDFTMLRDYHTGTRPQSSEIVVKWQDMGGFALDGGTAAVKWHTLTPDSASRDGNASKAVVWEQSAGSMPNWVEPEMVIDYDTYTAVVEVGRAAFVNVRAVERDGDVWRMGVMGKEVASTADTLTYRFFPPKGEWSYMVAESASASTPTQGHRWGIYDGAQMTLDAHVWNWGLNDAAVLRYGSGDYPPTEVKWEGDVETHATSGRRRPIATAGSTVKATRTVEGAAIIGKQRRTETKEAFKALAETAANGETVLYRSPTGDMATVVITSVSVHEEHGVMTVSVGMEEVD